MAFKTVGMNLIIQEYESFVKKGVVDEKRLDMNYKEIREFATKTYFNIKSSLKELDGYSEKHELDMQFGLALYEFLKSMPDFNSKYEADYSFWRYLAVYVIPDIIADRWGVDKAAHFYKKPTLIYPYQVYWYIHMSWQGSAAATLAIIKDNKTDQILQLVDRPSSIGVNLELYRCIMRKLAEIPVSTRQSTFRTIMLRNTSMLVNFRPEIYPGGVEGYVGMLFATT